MGLTVSSAVLWATSQVMSGSLSLLYGVAGVSPHIPGYHSPQHHGIEDQPTLTAQNPIACAATLTANHPSSQINLRSEPSLAGRRLGYGLVGDRLSILGQTVADDGYAWYQVQFQVSPFPEGWIRGDFIALNSVNCSIDAFAARSAVQSVEPDTRPDRLFSPSQVEYFLDVALGSEYGDNSARIRRWEEDICLNLNFPAEENISALAEEAVRSTVAEVIEDIQSTLDTSNLNASNASALLHGVDDGSLSTVSDGTPINISILGNEDGCDEANVEFFYVQSENFRQYDPNPRQGQVGHVWTWWRNNTINRARILISSNYLTDDERDHVIREEITQSLGILKDSWNYPTSIFYQGWTTTTDYDPIDEAVINMLYHPQIQPGMSHQEVEDVLNQLASK